MSKNLNRKQVDSLRKRLARNALGSFGLKITFVGLAFVTSVVLARLFGPEGYGVYSYAIAWLFVLQIPAELGMRALLVREVASYQARSEWGLMRGILRWANRAVLIVSVGIALLAAIAARLLQAEANLQLNVFLLALIALPLLALKSLRQSTLQGLHRVVVGQLPENLIQPSLFIIFLGCAYVLLGERLSVSWAMGIRVFTIGAAFAVGAEFLRRTLPQAVQQASVEYNTEAWMRSVIPFMLISCMNVINNRTDAIMLGAIRGPETVGLYVVAARGAELISFILVAVNQAIEPTIAKLYSEGNHRKLQRLITKSSRIIFFTSLPIALAFILFGHWFLFIFGPEFAQGRAALAFLGFGQLVNSATGSVGKLLNMTGHERDTAVGIGASAVLNIILNAVLIPRFGLEGAACATAISTIAWNILLFSFVKKRLGINTTVIG
ncbi:MAG: flippase [Cyanophyceae cyanobacterium]